ncbi:MAG TPA: hypothetical protein DEQ65_07090 [Ruminococcaceae bacterium]|nr:hypothetical protein [Oscillospiraceae bacterium]
MMTQIASTATRHRGGQKQLISNPQAKVTAVKPLFGRHRLRIFVPPYIRLTLTVYKGILKMLLLFAF